MPFLRTVQVEIDVGEAAQIIDGLYTKFDITFSTGDTPTDGVIEIYNLSPESRQRIRERGKAVKLICGYEDGIPFAVFNGQIRRVEHRREPPDYITAIHIGGEMLAREQAVWSANYTGTSGVETIVLDAIENFYPGVGVGDTSAIPRDLMETDFVFAGPTDAGIASLLQPYGLSHYEDRGLIYVSRARKGDASGVEISVATGMIGVPELTEDGLTVKTRISTVLRLGDTATILSTEMPVSNKEWKVVELQFVGDNRNGEFATVYTMAEVEQPTPPVVLTNFDDILAAQ